MNCSHRCRVLRHLLALRQGVDKKAHGEPVENYQSLCEELHHQYGTGIGSNPEKKYCGKCISAKFGIGMRPPENQWFSSWNPIGGTVMLYVRAARCLTKFTPLCTNWSGRDHSIFRTKISRGV